MIIADGGGQVRKSATTSATATYTFPVGNGSGTAAYSPVSLAFTGGTYAGYSSVQVTPSKHPNNANTTNYLKRYWTIGQSGFAGGWDAIVTATYVAGDVVGTQGNILMGQWTGALPWTIFTGSNSGFVLTSPAVITFGDFTGLNNTTPTVTVSPTSATKCAGSPATLTATGTGNGTLTYSWSPAAGHSATTGASVTATPTVTTTYSVTVTDGNGFTGTVATTTISINAVPAVSGGAGTNPVCGSSPSLLSASRAATYTWSPATNLSATTGASVTATPTVTTTYTVTGTNGAGCTNTATIAVTVNALPTIGASAVANPLCTPSSTTLNASGGTTYSWSPATGLSATTGSAVTATPTVTTTYTITGTASGCSNTATVALTVNTTPSVSIGAGANPLCSGFTSTLTASGATTYTWSPGTSLTATTGSSVTTSTTSPITYTVTGANGNCTNTATVAMTVNPSPSSVYSVTGGGSFCSSGIGRLLGLSGSDVGVTYKLYRGGSTLITTVAGTGSSLNFGWRSAAATFTATGTSNANGCTVNMTGNAVVSITPAPTLYTITGGGGYCGVGGTGVHVGLSGSDVGVNYQLINGTVNVGSPLAGTGAALDFGLQTAAGTYYYVVATSTITGCTATMTGSATVTVWLSLAIFVYSNGWRCLLHRRHRHSCGA